MLNDLILLSGNDIPLENLNLLLHPPTIKEIAYIGEEQFFTGCELIRFTKDRLTSEEAEKLEHVSNFEIIMTLLREKNPAIMQQRVCFISALSLLFPNYSIELSNKDIREPKIILEQNNLEFFLNKENYDIFVKALNEILCLGGDTDSSYNPSGNLAKRIADKLKDRHAKIAAAKNEKNQKISILSRYVSILSVGLGKDMNSLMNYTIYQLFDEFKRYQLKLDWDITMKAKLAGAKDVKDAEDWMGDIHSVDGDK